MDRGPFRMPDSSSDKSTKRTTEKKSAPVEVPRFDTPAPAPAPEKKSSPLKYVIILIIAAPVIAVLWFALAALQSQPTAINDDKYQAVVLTSGQTYFGKLEPLNDEFMRLTQVWYLQSQAAEESEDGTAVDSDTAQLIKLENQAYGPEDEIIISKSQILFYENLKPDGQAAQLIEANQ